MANRQRRQGLRQQGAVSRSGTRQGAGGRKQRVGGRGNLEPAEASVMRHALPWRRAPTIHHAAVAPPLAAPVSGEEVRGREQGWGGDWWGVAGQQDQAGWVAQHSEVPPRIAGAAAFPDRRRARAAARQQVIISRGGCGGRQPPANRAAPQAKIWKITKKCQRKFVVFGRFCHIKFRPPGQISPGSAPRGPANFQVLQ